MEGQMQQQPLSCIPAEGFFTLFKLIIIVGLLPRLSIIIERGVLGGIGWDLDGIWIRESALIASYGGYLVKQNGREYYRHGCIILGLRRYP
jgi:hypothetical protein